MDTLQIIKITKHKYYLADDILNLKLPEFNKFINGRRMVEGW